MTNKYKFRWTKEAMQKEVERSLNGHVTYNRRLAKDMVQTIAERLLGIVTELPDGNTFKITANARDGVFSAKVRIRQWKGWLRMDVI